MLKLRLFILVLVALVYGCNDCNKNDANILVSELLEYHASNRSINYCPILNKASKGDSVSLVRLFTLEINDGAVYDHAIVLVELADYLGEKKMLKYGEGLTSVERKIAFKSMRLGLEHSRIKQKDIEVVFPSLTDRWK
jgi:hypothetical protein